MTYSIKNRMGDVRPMAFEEYFDRFINDRGFSRGKSGQISISQGDYKDLKTKAEKYEALVEEHKKVKTQNDRLLKELDDIGRWSEI